MPLHAISGNPCHRHSVRDVRSQLTLIATQPSLPITARCLWSFSKHYFILVSVAAAYHGVPDDQFPNLPAPPPPLSPFPRFHMDGRPCVHLGASVTWPSRPKLCLTNQLSTACRSEYLVQHALNEMCSARGPSLRFTLFPPFGE